VLELVSSNPLLIFLRKRREKGPENEDRTPFLITKSILLFTIACILLTRHFTEKGH
jgi:hypothetical protein